MHATIRLFDSYIMQNYSIIGKESCPKMVINKCTIVCMDCCLPPCVLIMHVVHEFMLCMTIKRIIFWMRKYTDQCLKAGRKLLPH